MITVSKKKWKSPNRSPVLYGWAEEGCGHDTHAGVGSEGAGWVGNGGGARWGGGGGCLMRRVGTLVECHGLKDMGDDT